MALTIRNHWVVEAKELSTTKRGPGRLKGPKGIVYHFTSGWTTAGDIHTLTKSDRKASVQFIIGRTGQSELYQCMPANFRAWHAGPSRYKGLIGCNDYFIGIEICNIGYLTILDNGLYRDEYGNTIDGKTGKFVNVNRTTASPPNTWPTHPHKVIGSGIYAWEPYPAAQLDCVADLTEALVKYYPTIEHAVTHEEIDTRGAKSDPGPAFPMRRMKKIVEARSQNSVSPKDGIEYLPATTTRMFRFRVATRSWKSIEHRGYGTEFAPGEVVFPAATTEIHDATGAMKRYWLVFGDSGEGWVPATSIDEITKV